MGGVFCKPVSAAFPCSKRNKQGISRAGQGIEKRNSGFGWKLWGRSIFCSRYTSGPQPAIFTAFRNSPERRTTELICLIPGARTQEKQQFFLLTNPRQCRSTNLTDRYSQKFFSQGRSCDHAIHRHQSIGLGNAVDLGCHSRDFGSCVIWRLGRAAHESIGGEKWRDAGRLRVWRRWVWRAW